MNRRRARTTLCVWLLAVCLTSVLLMLTLPIATVAAQSAGPTVIPPTPIPGIPIITAPPPLPTLDPTQFPTDGTPEPPPGGSPTPNPQPNPSPIQQIITHLFQIFFPAHTFREAIEKTARAIFEGAIEELAEPLTAVLDIAVFANASVYGNVPLPGAFSAVADIMARAAVPLWALSLALMALAVVTRQAVGLGYGSNEVASEAVRWFFIALASGNGYLIVTYVHAAFGLLAREISGLGGLSAGDFVSGLLPLFGEVPLVLLILMVILAAITIIVLIVTYVARYAIMIAVATFAPLAIACEGIPFTRFVFRDWLATFLKLELLQILNVGVLVIFSHMALFGGSDGLVATILRLVSMIGLASALIGLNTAVFKQVFGTAIGAVEQMKTAVGQLVGAIAAIGGVVLTGGAALPAAGGSLNVAGAGGPPGSGSNPGMMTSSGLSEGSEAASRYAATLGSGSAGSPAPNDSGDARTFTPFRRESTAHAVDRDAYRLAGSSTGGQATAARGGAPSGENESHADVSLDRSPAARRTGATSGGADVTNDDPTVAHGAAHSRENQGALHAQPAAATKGERDTVPGDTNTHSQSAPAEAIPPSHRASMRASMIEKQSGGAATSRSQWLTLRISTTSGATLEELRPTVSAAGSIARSVARATGLGGVAGAALRGFGEGAATGDWLRRQNLAGAPSNYARGIEERQLVAQQVRAERLAQLTLGAEDPHDIRRIAAQIAAPQHGYTPEQMRQAFEAIAPLARDMSRQFGSPTRAAAIGGYGDYGELTASLAVDYLRTTHVEARAEAAHVQPEQGPLARWVSEPPGNRPGSTDRTPYDYAMGAQVTWTLSSAPGAAPEWARTMHSLRQAYGDTSMSPSVFTDFVARVKSEGFESETAARRWLENEIARRPPTSGRSVQLWWQINQRGEGGEGRPLAQPSERKDNKK